MRIGWVHDFNLQTRPGGAQVQDFLLLQGAPEKAEIVECLPGKIDQTCDFYIVARCLTFSDEEQEWLLRARFAKLEPDYAETGNCRRANQFIAKAQKLFFLSPLHWEEFCRRHWLESGDFRQKLCLMPSPLALPEPSNGARKGIVWLGEWQPHKGYDLVMEWAERQKQEVHFYGIGMDSMKDSQFCKFKGFVPWDKVPELLGQYETWIHFPRQPEPFPRLMAEALLCGCEAKVAGRFGFESYGLGIREMLQFCLSAPKLFWDEVEKI